VSEYFIRPAEAKDLFDLLKLSRSFPLYNLPEDKKLLKQKLEESGQSFKKNLSPFKRSYIFILEDLKSKQVIGSSQILSFSAKNRSYCYLLKGGQNSAYLKLISRERKRHQLGGLILSQKYRGLKEQFGLQLGLARFLYIKTHEKDFSKKIEVSLTSLFQKEDNPFWLETGAKHLKQNYFQALKLYRESPDSFLKKFPKEFTIYLSSLSTKARWGLETVHSQTLPAYKGLLKRGFQMSRRRHLLDGGIYLESKTSTFLKKIKSLEIKIEKPTKESFFLVSKKETKKPLKNFQKNNPQHFSGRFIAVRMKGEEKGRYLKIDKNSFFKEGEQVLNLYLS